MSASNRRPAKLSSVYQKLGRKLSKTVEDYLDIPNEARTHDLRVAIRRFRILTRQLPKKERAKALRRYVRRGGRFLGLSTNLRDLDVIRDRLAQHTENAAVPTMLKDLSRKRGKLVNGSMKTARKLRGSRLPKHVLWNSGEALSRLKKSLGEFDIAIPRDLAVVLKNEKNVTALHQLKKDVRKYRYLLELMPQNGGTAKACDYLRQLQDKLGEIRDSDVVIGYLKQAGSSRDVRELLNGERTFRSAGYHDLVKSYSKGIGNGGQSILKMAGFPQLRIATASVDAARGTRSMPLIQGKP